MPEYRKICREVLKLRRAGDLPYRWITDGTRLRLKGKSWADADAALNDLTSSYRHAMWHNQADYIEVWSEKDAISGMIAPVTDNWDVSLMIARGYSSETFLWNAAQDMREIGKPVAIYQLGDHDPDGVRAWNDIQRKLRGFAPEREISFQRLAITPDDLQQYGDLTRDAKGKGAAGFGPAMDVDAIPSTILRERIEDAIIGHVNPDALRITQMVEEQELLGLTAMARGWAL